MLYFIMWSNLLKASYIVKLHHHCLLQCPHSSALVSLHSLAFINVAFVKYQNKTPAFVSIKCFHCCFKNTLQIYSHVYTQKSPVR